MFQINIYAYNITSGFCLDDIGNGKEKKMVNAVLWMILAEGLVGVVGQAEEKHLLDTIEIGDRRRKM